MEFPNVLLEFLNYFEFFEFFEFFFRIFVSPLGGIFHHMSPGHGGSWLEDMAVSKSATYRMGHF